VLLARLVVEQRATLRCLAIVSAVTRRRPPARGASTTASSSTFSATRASPFATPAIERSALGGRLRMELGEPPLAVRERPPHDRQQVVLLEPAQNVDAAAREQREFTSKDGFSVVAPTRTIVPFSTWGRNASCCGAVEPMDLVDEEDGPHPVTGALAVGLRRSPRGSP